MILQKCSAKHVWKKLTLTTLKNVLDNCDACIKILARRHKKDLYSSFLYTKGLIYVEIEEPYIENLRNSILKGFTYVITCTDREKKNTSS